MIAGPIFPNAKWQRNKGLITFLLLFAISVTLSVYLAPYLSSPFKPTERPLIIEKFSTQTVHELKSAGNYPITYLTSGPKLANFNMACYSAGAPSQTPSNNCIEIPYDGRSGTVELRIPTALIREFDSSEFGVPITGRIGDIQGDWYKHLPFQRVSDNASMTVVRIELPVDSTTIHIIGAGSEQSNNFGNGIGVFWLGAGIFTGLALTRVGLIALSRKMTKVEGSR